MSYLRLGRMLNADERPAIVSDEDRVRHLLCLGSTGAGKTTFFLNLIKDDIDNGKAVIVLDPSGDLSSKIPADITVNKYSPMSLNPLRKGYDYSVIANELIDTVNSAVKSIVPQQTEITVKMKRILTEALKILEDPAFDFLIKFLSYFKTRENYFEGKMRPYFWQDFDSKGYDAQQVRMSAERICDRLSLYQNDQNIKPFITGKNEFDIADITRNKKTVVFDFKGMDDEATRFIGNLITHQLKTYYLAKETFSADPLFVYIDEFHLFISDLFDRFLVETRKHNVGFNFCGHSLKQVSPKLETIMLACYIIAALNVSSYDAEKMAKELQIKTSDILNIKKYEAIIGISKKPHHIRAYPPPNFPPKAEVNFWKDCYFSV
jgi:DNA helicase HerA-like ATPase